MVEQEKKYVAGWWFWTLLLVVAAAVILTVVGGGLGWFSKNVDTMTTRASIQYRTTIDEQLVAKMEQWYRLDTERIKYKGDAEIVRGFEAQQKALIVRMHETAHRVPTQYIPEDVREFLTNHPAH